MIPSKYAHGTSIEKVYCPICTHTVDATSGARTETQSQAKLREAGTERAGVASATAISFGTQTRARSSYLRRSGGGGYSAPMATLGTGRPVCGVPANLLFPSKQRSWNAI
jgi:hypothetical protein